MEPHQDLAERGSPTTDAETQARPPSLAGSGGRSRRGWLGTSVELLVVVVAAVYFLFEGGNAPIFTAELVLVYAIAGLGQDVLIGWSSQVSLGAAAFLAVGSFTDALLKGTLLQWFPIPLVIGMAVGALVGFLIGQAGVRIGGLYLLIGTLGLQYLVAFGAHQIQQTVSPLGEALSVPQFDGGAVQSTDRVVFAACLVCFLLVVMALRRLYRSSAGAVWRTLKEGQAPAFVMGIDVRRWKLRAFVVSSAITAGAGVLLAYAIGSVSYQTFSLQLAITLIIVVYLGGLASEIGPVVGAFLVVVVPQELAKLGSGIGSTGGILNWIAQNQGQVTSILFAALLVAVLILEPTGIVGMARHCSEWARRRTARRQASASLAAGTELASGSRRLPVVGRNQRVVAAATADGHRRASSGTTGASKVALDVDSVSVWYPSGASGVRDISFTMELTGRMVLITGAIGAGKTSLLRGIGGFPEHEHVRVTGDVRFLGRSIVGATPLRTSARGLVVVNEREKVFPNLTVEQNLLLCCQGRGAVEAVLDDFSLLRHLAQSRAGQLSGGQRQLLGIAMGYARRPRVLIVDELSLGLAPAAVIDVIDMLDRLRQRNADLNVIVADEVAQAYRSRVDKAVVLRNGRIAFETNDLDQDWADVAQTVVA